MEPWWTHRQIAPPHIHIPRIYEIYEEGWDELFYAFSGIVFMSTGKLLGRYVGCVTCGELLAPLQNAAGAS